MKDSHSFDPGSNPGRGAKKRRFMLATLQKNIALILRYNLFLFWAKVILNPEEGLGEFRVVFCLYILFYFLQ